NAAQSEVPPLHADVLFAREHALRLEAAAVVRHGQGDRQAPPLDAHALPGGARVPVAVRERLLQDPVDGDLRGQGAVAQLPGQLELHRLLRQRLVLDGKALDDLAQFAALEPGGAEGADEVADLAERPLEQPHRLAGARSSTWSGDRAAKMSCTGPSCMSSTMRCSSRSLVASRRREAARASASRTSVTRGLAATRAGSARRRIPAPPRSRARWPRARR